MGRKSTKVNTSQPKRTIYTSSSGTSQHMSRKPTTAPSQTPMNGKTSLGDTLKQGMATGLGFGLANAAIGSIASSMGRSNDDAGQTEISPVNLSTSNVKNPGNLKNPCESFLDLYTNCLKSQANIMEDNCEFFLAQFKNCQIKTSSNIQNI